MPRFLEVSQPQARFVLRALQQRIRVDGRSLMEARDVKISFGDELGQVEVVCGNTRIAVNTTAEVTTPYSDRPFDGIFAIGLELTPFVHPAIESRMTASSASTTAAAAAAAAAQEIFADGLSSGSGTAQMTESMLVRILEKSIRRSNALDLESLCITSGELCWLIRVDIHVLEADGGIIDAACIAAIAALKHFQRPEYTFEDGKLIVYPISERVPVPLSIAHTPICTTFSLFQIRDDGTDAAVDDANDSATSYSRGVDDFFETIHVDPDDSDALDSSETVMVVDAGREEEQLRSAFLAVTCNNRREICQMTKVGGSTMTPNTVIDCVKAANDRAIEVTALIDKALALDSRKRIDPRAVANNNR